MNLEKIVPYDVWKAFMYAGDFYLNCKTPNKMSISESCSNLWTLQKVCYHHVGHDSGLCGIQDLELGEAGSVSQLLLSRMQFFSKV